MKWEHCWTQMTGFKRMPQSQKQSDVVQALHIPPLEHFLV